jgi:alanine racemase
MMNPTSEFDRAGAVLTIDLDALVANWRALRGLLRPGADCGAAVKANAYGLGMARIAPALFAAGCRRFFVAEIEEGIELRGLLPDHTAEIYVLAGPLPRTEADFAAHDLRPVLNAAWQVELWARSAGPAMPPCALHLDTGMSRLGLSPAEVDALAAAPATLAATRPALVMSHLACSEDPAETKNAEQLAAFLAGRAKLPQLPASFANSGGILLGHDYHFDVVRPGAALYGLVPRPDAAALIAQVVRLQGKILQVRDVDSPMTVGYGATHRVGRKGRLATVAAGYADGYLRSLSNRGHAVVGGVRVPVVGRVSMDLITIDVTEAPDHLVRPGALVDLIGPGHTVDDLAAEAGTIGYEVLTSLSRRYARRYVGG